MNSQSARYIALVGLTQFFKIREILDVESRSQFDRLFQLIKGNAVGSEQDLVGIKTDLQSQPDFMDGHRIDAKA